MTDDDELKRAKGKFEKYPNEPPEVKEQKKSWMDRTVAGDINKVKEYATEKYEKVKEKFIEPASKEDASEKKAAKEIRKEVKDVEKEKSESSEPRRKTLGEQQLQWAKEKYNREHQQKFGLGNIGGGLSNRPTTMRARLGVFTKSTHHWPA